MKTSIFVRAFLLSITLHIVLGATSYALLYLSDYYTNHTLPTGRLLTADVTFEPVKSTVIVSHSVTDENDGDKVIPSSLFVKKKITSGKGMSKHHYPKDDPVTDDTVRNEHEIAVSSLPKPYQKLPSDQAIQVNYPEEERLEGREALCIIHIHVVNRKIKTIQLSTDSHNCLPAFKREAFIAIREKSFAGLSANSTHYRVPIYFRLEN